MKMFCPTCGKQSETVFIITVASSLISSIRGREPIRSYACDSCLVPKLLDQLKKSKRMPLKVGVLT